jgi:hypothetical protein
MSSTIAPMSGQSVIMAVQLIEQDSVHKGWFLNAQCTPAFFIASAPVLDKRAVAES